MVERIKKIHQSSARHLKPSKVLTKNYCTICKAAIWTDDDFVVCVVSSSGKKHFQHLHFNCYQKAEE